jgi:NTP pyrophosphatase (non-canonical NTP hydrolase)
MYTIGVIGSRMRKGTTVNDNEIQAIHDTAVAKGFWDGEVDANFVLAKLALIHSEVSEVLEAYRKQQGSAKILEEFADVFIRTYDLIVGLADAGILEHSDIDWVIREKMSVNASRPRLHGNLI